MMSKLRFYIFTILGIGLIANTVYLYPWVLTRGLFESTWIVLGTIAAISAYYFAYLTNYAPFQTFVMRIIFWGYTGMLFVSIMRRTFEYLSFGIPPFAILNTILYLAIVLLCVIEGHRLFYSYGVNKNLNIVKSNTKKSPNKPVSKKEDLTLVEGIGPVIQKVLYKRGITSYQELASTPAHLIKDILSENSLQQQDPTTWPKQARLAYEEKWDELEKWQDELLGGRK